MFSTFLQSACNKIVKATLTINDIYLSNIGKVKYLFNSLRQKEFDCPARRVQLYLILNSLIKIYSTENGVNRWWHLENRRTWNKAENFFIPIFLHNNGVNHWYFKLDYLIYQSLYFEISKVYDFALLWFRDSKFQSKLDSSEDKKFSLINNESCKKKKKWG